MSATVGEGDRAPGRPAACARWFRTRWRGGVPLTRVFWSDMVLTGTVVNGLATLLAVLLLAGGAPVPAVAAVHFAPLPYNVFLVAAVWRSAAAAGEAAALAARTAALTWLAVMTVL